MPDIVQLKNEKHRFVKSYTMPTTAGPIRTELPITEAYRRLNLYISGTVTVDAGGADGVLTAESILSLVRKVTLQGTSSRRKNVGDLKVIDGAALYQLSSFYRGTPPLYLDPTPITKGSAASPFHFSLPIDLETPFSSDPRQSLLNSRELTSLYLNIDWGDSSDVFSAGTITAIPVTCRISASEFVDEFSKSGKYSLPLVSYIEESTAATNSRLQIRLKRGNLIRGIMIKQFTRTAYFHTPVTTVINSVAIEVDREVRKEYTFAELQAQNKLDYQMVTVPTGYAVLEMMPEARYDTILDSGRFDDVDVVLDVTGVANSFVRIYVIELAPE